MRRARRDELLHFAEVTDALRVFPRLFLLSCFVWCVWLTYQLMFFYFTLAAGDRSIAVSSVVTGVQGLVLGFLKMVYGDYRKDGRKWGLPAPLPGSVTTATTATSTTVATPPQAPAPAGG